MKPFSDLEAQHGLPSGLLSAVMQQESGGNTRAVSPRGARGAFQFMPATAKQYGVDVNDLTSSATGAARMYADLLKQSGGDLPKALAGYNWGQGNVQRKGMDNMPTETRDYIQKVTANMKPQAANPFDQFDTPDVNPFDQFDNAPQAAAPTPDRTAARLDTGRIKAAGETIIDSAAGIGTGVGQVALGAQRYLGKYANFIGAENAGNWLINDATQGREKLTRELAPHKARSPIAVPIGEIGGNIAATLPVGGAFAQVPRLLAKVPALASQIPRLNAAATALRTGGFRTGLPAATTLAGKAGQMALRSGAGGAVGYSAAGLVDEDSAGFGGAIGMALPPSLKVAGMAGGAAKRVISGPVVAEPLRKAVEAARGAGYVIPPSQAKPSLFNRLIEGFSGKITTAQNASARNQDVTQGLIAKSLGLPDGTPVSLDALKAIRTQAGNAYKAVGSTGMINTTPAYYSALDEITVSAKQAAAGFPNAKINPLIDEIESLKSAQFDASSAVAKINELRGAADAAYASGNKELGKALKSGSAALEDAIEAHLATIGAPQSMLSGFRDARQLIAKTYSVEKAMNATTGNVSAIKLGNQLAKGKPLSGGIRDVAAFGQQFPKAAQSIEGMGSLPQTSPLDWIPAAAAAAATGNPLMMAGVLARPAARKMALSGMVQNRLATPQGPSVMGNLPRDPGVQQMLYRTAPIAGANLNAR